MFITMLVSLFTVRVVFRALGVVDYGIYNVIGGVVTSISFVTSVLANASQRFFSVELGKGDDNSLKKVFNQLVFVYAIVAVIVFILAETIGLWFLNTKMDIPAERMVAANWVYQFAICSVLASLMTSPFQSIIIAHENMRVYAYLSILDVVLKLLIVYFLMMFSFDKLKLYAILMFLATLIIGLVYLIYSRRKFKETHFMWVWDKTGFRSIFDYSMWIIVGSFSNIVNTQGINILLNLFFGPVANAAYAVGNQVRQAVVSFASNFYTATRPPIIKSYVQHDDQQTIKLFYFSSKMIFIFLYVLIVPLFIGIDAILELWLGEVSMYMPFFVRLMLIYALVLSMSEPITTIVQAAGKVKKYHGIVDVFTLVSLPIVYLVFKHGGSVYWGFGIPIFVFLIAHIIRLFILKSFYPFSLSLYIGKLVIPVLVSILITIGGLYVMNRFLSNHLFLVIMMAVCLSVFVSWIFILDNSERVSVKQIAQTFLHKWKS
jgi:O-antigen/teichoic acid export membrane protein